MSTFTEIFSFLNSINKPFSNPNFFLEQYNTTIGVLRSYFEFFPSKNSKIVMDLGIGTGILSFLALQQGSKQIIGIDIDKNPLIIAKESADSYNIKNLNLIHSSVEFFNFSKFRNKINGVIMNPPFGTKRKYLDFVFLKKAMSINGWILTLHKNNNESNQKLLSMCDENNYHVLQEKKLTFYIPKTYKVHTQETHKVEVILYLLNPNL